MWQVVIFLRRHPWIFAAVFLVSCSAMMFAVLNDGSRYQARLVGRDSKTDLALLKIDAGRPLPFVDLAGSEQARVGDWVLAVLLYILAVIGFSGSNIFYDSLLPFISSNDELDRTSAFGFAFGYLGGGLLFTCNILMVLHPEAYLEDFQRAGLRRALERARDLVPGQGDELGVKPWPDLEKGRVPANRPQHIGTHHLGKAGRISGQLIGQ